MIKLAKEYNTPLYVIITTILVFFNGLMLIFTKEILEGAKFGLLLWYNKVLPSLFPFMVFTSMLIYTGFPKTMGRVSAPFCKRIFNTSGEGGFAIVIGLLSGCPLGAKTACDLYKDGLVTKNEAGRLVMFCNNTGPLFVLGTVGEGIFGNSGIGIKLLLVQYISALIIGIFLGVCSKTVALKKEKGFTPPMELTKALSNSVSSAVNSITLVGGFIVFFAVVAVCLEKSGAMDLGAKILSPFIADMSIGKGFIYGILEVTGGVSRIGHSYGLAAALIAWGGLSIHAQSAAFIAEAGLSVKKYLLSKAIQGFIAFFVWQIGNSFGIL